MPSSNGKSGYEVHNSAAFAREFRQLRRQAARQGRGEEFLRAARAIVNRLRQDPNEFGEPLYRLSGLRMQVRSATIRPLHVDFAVCEDRPLVFIKAVKLL
jgi:hypothetical protein